ncbi:LOW QUALITY PROTEIN: hypothetical protein V1478_007303 [Vespula squamosa]|uniref:Uncharacterized protein n=1 Tax=Vespula squamosa TaxID=30214 RepID=A0ABD2B2S8_VESSQ
MRRKNRRDAYNEKMIKYERDSFSFFKFEIRTKIASFSIFVQHREKKTKRKETKRRKKKKKNKRDKKKRKTKRTNTQKIEKRKKEKKFNSVGDFRKKLRCNFRNVPTREEKEGKEKKGTTIEDSFFNEEERTIQRGAHANVTFNTVIRRPKRSSNIHEDTHIDVSFVLSDFFLVEAGTKKLF